MHGGPVEYLTKWLFVQYNHNPRLQPLGCRMMEMQIAGCLLLSAYRPSQAAAAGEHTARAHAPVLVNTASNARLII